MQIREKVLKALQEATGAEKIEETMSLSEDLMLTSLNAMKLIYRLEEELGIKDIPMETFYEAETVGQLIDAIEKLA